MDIEPLWDLGGWFFLFIACMAAPKSQSTLAAAAAAESHSFLLLLALSLFTFLLLLNPTTTNHHPMNSPNVTPSIPFKRLLLHASSKPSTPTPSSMSFHPTPTSTSSSPASTSSSRREFGAGAHEVPSGPNPISNR
ncbi:hypothetical protein HRI_001287100 [Hibiscus trionum]|uniref:Uncharacterized protein n=1 Tax=Hibiscus trionum TaxID=183268 RepID=A0A9W7HG19_HIBTR|nr:hypothetical protein HRI_001287100 [Hibiscus trionum]